MYTIGKLSKESKLSRSTLLYYDKIGILKASARSESNYRLYADEDLEKLKIIVQHKNAGFSLEDISKLFDFEKNSVTDILTNRLKNIQSEINDLKRQESMILSVLIDKVKKGDTELYDKDKWTTLLTSLNYSEEDLLEWHRSFEKSSSKEHEVFLKALGMSLKEIKSLRLKL